MDTFQYESLPNPKSWIRVLILENGQGSESLRASLQHVELCKESDYEAISYCWGSSEKPHRIHLQNTSQQYDELPITASLYLALVRFRKTSECRRLWTDAICINQTNNEEKEHQVRLMDQIYAVAGQVLVYLGEPDSSTRQAVQLLQKVYKAAVATPSDDLRRPMQWISDHKLPSAQQSEIWKWDPVKTFFRRPWFQRKWIIQECVLASQVVFHCGKWEREWKWMAVLERAMRKYAFGLTDWTTLPTLEEANQLRQGLSQFNSIARMKDGLTQNVTFSLLDLAYHFHASAATDPRDHLFALLGLAYDSKDEVLNPKYGPGDTILQTCVRYAQHFLEKKPGLEVLYRAGMQGHKLFAPSWIPDWYGGQEGNDCEYTAGPWDPLLRPPFYQVTRDKSIKFVQTTDSTVLGLKGSVIDTVNKLANKHLQGVVSDKPSKDHILEQKRKHLEECDSLMAELKTYPTGQDLTDVKWRTLICNVTIDLQRAPDTYKANFDAWKRMVLMTERTLEQFESDRFEKEPYRQVIDNYNADKVFGVSKEGYVGMFPQTTRQGDVVAFLHGGDFPFVLRRYAGTKNTAKYELVGQCYIHGIMEEGELEPNNPRFKEEIIFLGGDYDEYVASA